MSEFGRLNYEIYGPFPRHLEGRQEADLEVRGYSDANPPSWAPSTAQIASIVPAYTRSTIDGDAEHSGAESDDFSTTTTPTLALVQELIQFAVSEVAGLVGIGIDALGSFPDLARVTVGWRVASTIEADRAPAGAQETAGAYAWKQAAYLTSLAELKLQARRQDTRLW